MWSVSCDGRTRSATSSRARYFPAESPERLLPSFIAFPSCSFWTSLGTSQGNWSRVLRGAWGPSSKKAKLCRCRLMEEKWISPKGQEVANAGQSKHCHDCEKPVRLIGYNCSFYIYFQKKFSRFSEPMVTSDLAHIFILINF